MAERPEGSISSEEPIEIHTGDVEPLTGDPEIKTDPGLHPQLKGPVDSGPAPVPATADDREPTDPHAHAVVPEPEPEPGSDPDRHPSKPFAALVADADALADEAFQKQLDKPGPPVPPDDVASAPEPPKPEPQPAAPPPPPAAALTSDLTPVEPEQQVIPAPPTLDPVFLCVARGPGAGISVAIPEGAHPIGRSANCFLSLAHPSLHPEHAVLRRTGNRFYVCDAGGPTGTVLNGRRIDALEEMVPGDQIVLGEAFLVLRSSPVTDPELTMPGLAMPPRRHPAFLWIAAVVTALASAALASVFLAPPVERLFHSPASDPPPPPAATLSLIQPTPEPKPPPKLVDPLPADISLVGDIEVKLAPEPAPEEPVGAQEPIVQEPSPSPAPLPSPAPTPMHAPTPVHKAAPHRPVAEPVAMAKRPTPPPPEPVAHRPAEPPSAPAPTPAPTPAAKPTGTATEALRLFNEGQVEPAIAAAKAAGATPLLNKLSAFQREASAGQANASEHNGAGAIQHLTAAATLDDELTRGWSKPGADVRAELTVLYIAAGEQALNQDNPTQAVTMLQKALEYGPGNAKAEKLLADARSRKPSGKSAPAAAAPAPTPAPKAEPTAAPKTEPAPAPAKAAPAAEPAAEPTRRAIKPRSGPAAPDDTAPAPATPAPDGQRRPLKPADKDRHSAADDAFGK
jgi:hypothetical protein